MAKSNFSTNSTGPRGRNHNKPSGQQIPLDLNEYQISYDVEAFDAFIRSQGIFLVHYRSIPDPSGMLTRGDTHAVGSERQSSDGFIYQKAGECRVLFTSNSQQYNIQPEGALSLATAYITFPRNYEGCDKPILVHPWDRFYLKDVEIRVVNTQFVEANSTGVDRLQYPATCVECIIDADSIEYKEGSDFEITPRGDIKWIGQKRPGINVELGRGKVYAIRYRYTPFFVAAHLIHEIRVAQVTDPATYQRSVERLHYQVRVVREHVLKDVNRDEETPVIDNRFQHAPPSGGALGPK